MEPPSSPGTSPIDLRDSIEELVKFILQSQENGTLDIDIGLPKDICFSLLNPKPGAPVCSSRLASALYESIISGGLSGFNFDFPYGDDEFKAFSLKQKNQWEELIRDQGSELTNVMKTVSFELHVQEPYFTQIKVTADGLKTIEGRCAVGDYNRIASGTFILFNKCLVLEVQDVHHYASFSEMLQTESLAKVLPGVKTVEEGVQVYRKFYTEEKEKSNGVLAISVAKLPHQPYLSLARMLSGLTRTGLLALLCANNSQTSR